MLHERADFNDLLRAAADSAGIPLEIAEKDYFVTEVLRALQDGFGEDIVFKGGSSLSKGWKIIDRFSEDVDIFVRLDLPPDATKSKINRVVRGKLKAIQTHVSERTELQPAGPSFHSAGKSRVIVYSYTSALPQEGTLPATVRLEMGVRSGSDPYVRRRIDSVISEFARDQGLREPDVPNFFEIDLLHFTRTFVEKLSCVHSLALDYIRNDRAIGRNVRHYADLYALAGLPEVQRFVGTADYEELRENIAQNTAEWFSYAIPLEQGAKFADSPAVAPGSDLRRALRVAYQREVPQLFFRGDPPGLDDVLERLGSLAPRL